MWFAMWPFVSAGNNFPFPCGQVPVHSPHPFPSSYCNILSAKQMHCVQSTGKTFSLQNVSSSKFWSNQILLSTYCENKILLFVTCFVLKSGFFFMNRNPHGKTHFHFIKHVTSAKKWTIVNILCIVPAEKENVLRLYLFHHIVVQESSFFGSSWSLYKNTKKKERSKSRAQWYLLHHTHRFHHFFKKTFP